MDVNGNKEGENGGQVVVEMSSSVSSKENRADSQIPRTLTARKSLKRPILPKPKSRFGEQSYRIDSDMLGENNHGFSSALNTPKEADDDDEDIVKIEAFDKEKSKKQKVKKLIKWVGVVCIISCLVASLTVDRLKKRFLWGLEVWEWCLLATVIICGMIFSNWVMEVIVNLCGRNYLLEKKLLYFAHGLKKSGRVALWLTLVLVTWASLLNWRRSRMAGKILDGVTWSLVCLVIGAVLWLVKTLSMKIVMHKLRMNRYFDRIQDSIFHYYVLRTLSRPPSVGMGEGGGEWSGGRLCFKCKKTEQEHGERVMWIDMGKAQRVERHKVSAWTMKRLVEAVSSSEMSISRILDESCRNFAHADIADDMKHAAAVASKIFNNIDRDGNKIIERANLREFLSEEQIDRVLPYFGVAETVHIDIKALTDFVVKAYKERETIAYALTDTKTAVKQLNNLVTALVIIVTAIIWLLLMEIATTQLLLFLLSQLAVVVFMFGNSCKTTFEAIIFVFVIHPFDVGDRCVVDDVPLLVEEMNILTTVFLKLNNEKMWYPNSVLATKPITNYYRSPHMSDTVEFSIGFTTPLERIGAMKERIKRYLKENPQHWHPVHSVVVKEIEDVNKIKMALYTNHTMNFQDWPEKTKRRTELMMELKKIFEELNINYTLLPQTVHLNYH